MKSDFRLNRPLPLVVQYTNKKCDGFAVDLGCGAGQNSIFLAEQGYSVDAVDNCDATRMPHVVADFTERLPRSIRRHKLTITPHHCDVETFLNKCPSDKYDLVVVTYLLHFFQKDTKTPLYPLIMPKIVRVLKTGGRLICTMLKSKVLKETRGEIFFPEHVTAMRELRSFESPWHQKLRVVHYETERLDDTAANGSPSIFEYSHWELVADKAT